MNGAARTLHKYPCLRALHRVYGGTGCGNRNDEPADRGYPMKMRVIPTKGHGTLDYVTAPALVAAREAQRLNGGQASAVAPRAAGIAAAIYGALTDYELDLRRIIPMRAHLALDALGGAAVAAAPWVSGS